MAKHAPGPWAADIDVSDVGDDIEITAGEGSYHVATVTGFWTCAEESEEQQYEEASANAALISAAPDLLAACEQAYSLIGPHYAGESLMVSQQLAAAIAKAKSAK